MSERMTEADAPGVTGLAEWGRKTRAEMIAAFRRFHQERLDEAMKALALPDDQITTTTYLGPYARRNEQEVK